MKGTHATAHGMRSAQERNAASISCGRKSQEMHAASTLGGDKK